jgi:integrase
MRVLEQEVDGAPLWTAKSETASRLRGRIEAVLDWAKVHGYREGENPARWKGHLDNLLPARGKVRKVEHHAALPHREMPGFVAELQKQEGTAAKAFEFAILTAARTNEALGAVWSEIDFNERIWAVPSNRMKGGREHRVPLADKAIAILKEMRSSGGESGADAFIFPARFPTWRC